MTTTSLRYAALVLAATFFSTAASAHGATPQHWVTAWSAAVQAPMRYPGGPTPITLDGQTIREIVRPTISGTELRVRFSNELGDAPLVIADANIAITGKHGSIIRGSERPLTFNGKRKVQIPAGAPMLSDPVDLKVPAFASVAISIYVPASGTPSTFHLIGQQPTLISERGDFVNTAHFLSTKEVNSWYWLSDLEFWGPEQTAAVMTLGDSITDGFGVAPGAYQDWPDQLADRLAQTKDASVIAIDNEGIGGNRLLYNGAGVNALARVDRDILAKPGARLVILLEGINDIVWPSMKPLRQKDGSIWKNPFVDQVVTASQLISGMKQVINRVHAHGMKIFGATITPYKGSTYFNKEGEGIRETVNQWIRTSGAFDGVIDFDAAVRDPADPQQFRNGNQSGDHLHPNAAGYAAMAASISIVKLRAALK